MREVQDSPPENSVLEAEVLGLRSIDAGIAQSPGIVLELCVPMGSERIYSEFLVNSYEGRLYAPFPTFWLPRSMVGGASADGLFAAPPGQGRDSC